ncbi:UNVERIFIED_CONTAM: hypothetical protein HDU68_002210 [Siphonaria sp. JEL0065]|nr:hypothetical protein HDU68_002210 [Siphonaria sp. JEL0065]
MAFGVQLQVDHPSLTPIRLSSPILQEANSSDSKPPSGGGGGGKPFDNSYTAEDVIDEMKGKNLENNQQMEEIISAFGVGGVATPRSMDSIAFANETRLRSEAMLKNSSSRLSTMSNRSSISATPETTITESSSRLSVSYTPNSDRSRSRSNVRNEDLELQAELPLLEREIKYRMYPVIFKAGDYIIRKHDIGNEMYFLSKGTVEVVSGDGKTVYSEIHKGSFFGELGVLFNVPRTASVRAMEECYCMVLTRDNLEIVLNHFPTIAKRFRQVAEIRMGEVKKLISYKQMLEYQQNMESNTTTPSLLAISWNWSKHVLVGTAFGFALEKAKVYLPSVIISQMKWTQLSMLVVFMTATVSGLTIVSVLEKVGIYKRCAKPPVSFGANLLNGYGGNVVGGALVGIGMTLSGACPGTVLLQIGTGVPSAPYVVTGALFGSITFGYIEKWFKIHILPRFGSKKPIHVIDTSSTSIQKIAIIASIVGFPVLWFASRSLIPWRSDFIMDFTTDFGISGLKDSFKAVAEMNMDLFSPVWSPFVSGLAIGGVQLLSILWTDSVLGASSVYPYLGSVFVRVFDSNWEKNAPFYKGYTDMAHSVRFSIGTIGGAYLSARMGGLLPFANDGNVFIKLEELVIARLVVGGIALVYGSRIAGGCTSGHGLSGMAQLSVASVVTVMAMFGAGSLMAFFV